MNKILEIKHLGKNYHDKNGEIIALSDISLDVFSNEFLSIVGPSGCGKSTLLSILSNLEKETYGNIRFFKNDLKIGYMLQTDCLFPWRSILDNCLVGLEVSGTLNDKAKKRVIRLLKKYGLGEFINKYPSSLSGGMRH